MLAVSFITLLAQGAPVPPVSPNTSDDRVVSLWTTDMAAMVALGILFLLVLAFFARQSFGSKRRRRKKVSESRSVPEASTLPRVPTVQESRRNRRRRRRRSHRPSNPTLAETGGLPPERSVEAGANNSGD